MLSLYLAEGASSRLIALFHMGSTVVRQQRTGYVEWYYNSLKPGENASSASF